MTSPWLYLLTGPDRAGKLQRVQALERAWRVGPLDHHHFDAAQLSAPALIAACRQQPAESPVRLIVIEHAHRLDRAGVEALLDHAPLLSRNARVVLFVETELSVRHPLMAAGEAVAIERFPGRETPAAKPFAMADALGAGDVAGALGALHDQLAAGKEPLELLGLMAWQLQRWVVAKRLEDAGCGAEAIAGTMGLRPWQAQRMRAELANRPLASLQELLERCWQLDTDAKRGRAIPELAVEELLVTICQREA